MNWQSSCEIYIKVSGIYINWHRRQRKNHCGVRFTPFPKMISICEQNTGRWYVLPQFHLIFHVTHLPSKRELFSNLCFHFRATIGKQNSDKEAEISTAVVSPWGWFLSYWGDIWQYLKMLLVVRAGDGALLASSDRDQGHCKASCKI